MCEICAKIADNEAEFYQHELNDHNKMIIKLFPNFIPDYIQIKGERLHAKRDVAQNIAALIRKL